MLNLNGTGKGAYDEPNFIYHLRKTFIVEGVDETLMYFLPFKKKNLKLLLKFIKYFEDYDSLHLFYNFNYNVIKSIMFLKFINTL